MNTNLRFAPVLLSALLLAAPAWAETAPAKTATPAATHSSEPRLSDAKYKIFKDAMSKARAENKTLNEQIRTKREELTSLMTAPTFDKAAYLAKHAEMQSLIDKAAANRAEATASAAAQFGLEDRKILAKKAERSKKRFQAGAHDKGANKVKP